MFESLLTVGDLTGTKMNRSKCHPPAQIMDILGFCYNSIERSCSLSKKKQQKYLNRIDEILNSPFTSFKELEKIVGNLTYAAWIAPFARPFLSTLSEKLHESNSRNPIAVSTPLRTALQIWKYILVTNHGLTFDFILCRLPRAKHE